jgi:Peptidase family S41
MRKMLSLALLAIYLRRSFAVFCLSFFVQNKPRWTGASIQFILIGLQLSTLSSPQSPFRSCLSQRVVCLLCSFLCASCTSEEKKLQLEDEAISIMRTHHRFAANVDWQSFKKELKSDFAYHSLASRMRRITQSVGDPHTFWVSAKDAAEKGLTESAGSKIPKIVASASNGVAMIAIPSFASGDDQSSLLFSDTLQVSIESLAEGRPKAWIIDLRENEGGNMWPMIAGLNCFLNDGPLEFFRLASGQDVKWKLEKNKVSLVDSGESNMAHPQRHCSREKRLKKSRRKAHHQCKVRPLQFANIHKNRG